MKRSLLPLLLLVCTSTLFAQRAYNVFHYTSREGLPQNSVRSLAFDQFGFLWMTTEAGIVRYDGNTFKTLSSKDNPAFTTDRFGLATKINDTTIIFTDQYCGIHELTGNKFKTHASNPSILPHYISIRGGLPNIAELSRFINTLTRNAWPRRWNAEYIYCFPMDANRYFIVNSGNLIEYHEKGKEIDYIQIPDLKPAEFFMINGRLMAFNHNREIFRFDLASRRFLPCRLTDKTQGNWEKAPLKKFIYSSYPFENALLSHEKDLYKISESAGGESYEIEWVLHGLPVNCIINNIVCKSGDQLIAVATDTEGLFLFKEQFFSSLTYDLTEPGTNNAYYAQALLEDDVILTSYSRMFATKGQNKGFIDVFSKKFITHGLYTDSTGTLWYCSMDTLFAMDTRQHQTVTKAISTKANAFSFLWGKNKLWVGTRFGIGYVKDDSLVYADQTVFKHGNNAPQVMCFDEKGRIWYGVVNNLYCFDPESGKVDSFEIFYKKTPRAIQRIGDKMFIGTYGHGYYVFYNNRFFKMPADRNGEMVHVHAFYPDKKGYLWIPTNRGLFKTSMASIEAFLQDTTQSVFYTVYREEDGIRNAEFNGGCSPPYVVLSDGRVSMPTMGGLVLFKPEDINQEIPKDTILIEALLVDGRPISPLSGSVVPFGHQTVEVHFATAWWQLMNNLDLSYKLEGVQAQWQYLPATQRQLMLGRLTPGNHTLVLRKRFGFGKEDFTETRLSFKVAFPWFLQWWALSLGVIAAAGLLWLVISLYTRTVRKRNLLLQHQVESQTQELQKANELLTHNLRKLEASESGLRQSLKVKDRLITIFSHDILTPLRFIGMIARFAIPAKSRDNEDGSTLTALRDIRNASDKLFEHTQNILDWIKYQDKNIHPALANISPYAIVEQLLEDFSELAQYHGNKMVNAIPEDDVIRTDPKILTIILHNLLSNAIKFTQNGVITMGGCFADGHYLLNVTDTGRGMTADQMEQLRNDEAVDLPPDAATASAGNSLGFVLIKELLEVLGGDWTIDGAVNEGVSVVVKLPVG